VAYSFNIWQPSTNTHLSVFSVHVKYAFVLQEFLNYNFNYGAMTTSVCALSLISKQYALNTTIIKKAKHEKAPVSTYSSSDKRLRFQGTIKLLIFLGQTCLLWPQSHISGSAHALSGIKRRAQKCHSTRNLHSRVHWPLYKHASCDRKVWPL